MSSSFDNYVLPLHPSLFEKQLSRDVHSLQFIVAKYILDKTSFNVHTIGKDVLPETLKQYLVGLKSKLFRLSVHQSHEINGLIM